jgi:hypothetical protein
MKTLNITLANAVEDTVNFFTKYNTNFSIYEITQLIRCEVNYKKYQLDGVDVTDDENMIQFVSHGDVKDIFLDMFSDGTFEDLKMVQRGDYNVYGLDIINDDVNNILDEDDEDDEDWEDALNISTPTTSVNTTVAASTTSTTLDEQLVAYISKKGQATLKQIQSRLKIKGMTCADLLQIISKNRKLDIDTTSDYTDVVSRFVVTLK